MSCSQALQWHRCLLSWRILNPWLGVKTDLGCTAYPLSFSSMSVIDNCCHHQCHLTTPWQWLFHSDSPFQVWGPEFMWRHTYILAQSKHLFVNAPATIEALPYSLTYGIKQDNSVSRKSLHHTLSHTWLLLAERLRPLKAFQRNRLKTCGLKLCMFSLTLQASSFHREWETQIDVDRGSSEVYLVCSAFWWGVKMLLLNWDILLLHFG